MLVDIQITTCFHLQIKRAVPGYEFQHMVEKADSRGNASSAAPVQRQAEADIGLVRFTMNCRSSRHFSAHSGLRLATEASVSFAHRHGIFVRKQIFCPCENPYIAGQTPKAFAAYRLHADALHKIRGGYPATPAGPAARWQNMVAATRVIAKRLRTPRADKDRAGSRNLLESQGSTFRKAEMFRRKTVHKLERLVAGRGEQNHSPLFQGNAGRICFREFLQLFCNFA